MRHIIHYIYMGSMLLSVSMWGTIVWDRDNDLWSYQHEMCRTISHNAPVSLRMSHVGRMTGCGATRIGHHNPDVTGYDTYVQTAYRDGDMVVDHAQIDTISGIGTAIVKNGSYIISHVRTGDLSQYDSATDMVTVTGACQIENSRIHNIPRVTGKLLCDMCWGGDTYRVYGSADLAHTHVRHLVIDQRRPHQMELPGLHDALSLEDECGVPDTDGAAFVQDTTPRMQQIMIGMLYMDYIKQRQSSSEATDLPMAFMLAMQSCKVSSVDIYDDGASSPYLYIMSHLDPVHISCYHHTGYIVTNTPDKIIPHNAYIIPLT